MTRPTWREARAAALEAEAERLADFLVDLDEIEQVVIDDETYCIELRAVAGRARARASTRRDEADALRAILESGL